MFLSDRFASLFRSGPGDSSAQTELVNLARTKLLNTVEWRPFSASDEQLLALLGSLVPLALSKKTLAYNVLYNIQDKLVESHLGILAKYHPHLGLMEVSRPSEPLLAIATLSALDSISCSLISFFTETLHALMLSRGEAGEILVMMMFVIAHRRALTTSERSASPEAAGLHPSDAIQPTPTSTFMERFLRCNPDQASLLGSFTSQMGNTRLFQFIRIEEKSLPSEEQMVWAYQRGCGFACFLYQPGTDLIIPTSDGGAILIEVKNRNELGPSKQAEAHKKLSTTWSKMPYLSSKSCIQLLVNVGHVQQGDAPPVDMGYEVVDKCGSENPWVLSITVNALEGLALLEDKRTDPDQAWLGTITEAQTMLQHQSKSARMQDRDKMDMRMKPLAGPGPEYLPFCCREISAASENVDVTRQEV